MNTLSWKLVNIVRGIRRNHLFTHSSVGEQCCKLSSEGRSTESEIGNGTVLMVVLLWLYGVGFHFGCMGWLGFIIVSYVECDSICVFLVALYNSLILGFISFVFFI